MPRNILPKDEREAAVARAVQSALHVDDLQPAYRDLHARGGCDRYTGHCFVATNAFWHMMGARNGPYRPRQVGVGNVSHWFLVDTRDGAIVDLTASQFGRTRVPYEEGRGVGMQGPARDTLPTGRARAVLERLGWYA
jgi:hypothetical protein